MFFKPYYLGCLAHASYLIGGDNGEAMVIDPRRDIEEYLADASAANLTIRYVLETHLHADFVSGHVEMARRTGATILLGAGTDVAFAHQAIHGGEVLSLGDLTLRFWATPGHTPEGVVALAEAPGQPARLFTGDTLFLGDVGRPDLVGARGYTSTQMAQMLYTSLRETILPLDDATEIWPAHGAGSACGKNLSEERVSTLGAQKATNYPLQLALQGDEAGFVHYATDGLTAPPSYFFHDAAKNKEAGLSLEAILRNARPLTPQEVEAQSEEGILLLDTRASEAFKQGHLPGAVQVGLDGNFAPYVGTVVPPSAPLIVIAEKGREEEVMTRLVRVGYENILGWLAGGIDDWRAAGGEVVCVETRQPADLKTQENITVVDVRTQSEWDAGHLEGAIHIPLAELVNRLDQLPPEPFAVLCGSGYRSVIALSLLLRQGYRAVTDVAGGWKGYTALG